MDAVRAIRNRRRAEEMNVPPSKKAKVLILTEKKDTFFFFRRAQAFFPKLAYASAEIELIDAVPADAAKRWHPYHRRRTDLYADGDHRL